MSTLNIARLEAEATAAIKRMGMHAHDEVAQHLVQIDALKVEVRELTAAKEGWRRRCLDSDSVVDSLREEIKKLTVGEK